MSKWASPRPPRPASRLVCRFLEAMTFKVFLQASDAWQQIQAGDKFGHIDFRHCLMKICFRGPVTQRF